MSMPADRLALFGKVSSIEVETNVRIQDYGARSHVIPGGSKCPTVTSVDIGGAHGG